MWHGVGAGVMTGGVSQAGVEGHPEKRCVASYRTSVVGELEGVICH